MTWNVSFYKGVDDLILKMPASIQARLLRLLELLEEFGVNVGPPHSLPMGGGLFEVRAKAKDGIGRALYCYRSGNRIVVLHVFVKKSQKTPLKELRLARKRMLEVLSNE